MHLSSHLETLAVHAGREPDPHTGAVSQSPVFSTTFARDEQGKLRGDFLYSRTDNPTRRSLEQALAALETAVRGLAFASGQAATAAILQSLEPGARIFLPDDIYHGTRNLVKSWQTQAGSKLVFLDFSSLSTVAEALQNPVRSTTRDLVWIETPSNPLLKITDIAAVAELAHAIGALVVVDNSWATSILCQPLELGADISLHATTKYIGGHSDVLGGVLLIGQGCPGEVSQRLIQVQQLGGAVPSPFDCWLLLRSLATLPLRVRAQTHSAGILADWLARHVAVAAVHYPGLSSHPGHQIASRQMAQPGAMLSFQVRGGADEARAVAGKMRLITRATSLGGVETLIEHRRFVEGPDSTTPPNLLRLSVGLEHVEDLLADLAQALGN